MQHWECPVPGQPGLLLLGALLLGFEGTQSREYRRKQSHWRGPTSVRFLEGTDVVLLAGSCSAGDLWVFAGQ